MKTQEDIDNLSIPATRDVLTLEFRKDILDQNVFRNKKGNPLHYDKFRLAFKEMARKAGFPGRVSPYHIRRGAGIAIDSVATTAQRMHAMNHAGQDVFKAYQLPTTLVDTQAAFMRQDAKLGLKDKLLSSGLLRDPDAPVSLSATEKKEIDMLPEYMAAKKSVAKMKSELKVKYGRKYVQMASDGEKEKYKKVRLKWNNIRRKLEKETRDNIRQQYFANACNEEIRRQFQNGTDKAIESKQELDVLSAFQGLGKRVKLLLDMVCEKLGSEKLGCRNVAAGKLETDTLGGEAKLDCVYCDATDFSTKYTLKKHVVAHLGKLEQPWCMKCDKHYADKACLQVHLLDFHDITT